MRLLALCVGVFCGRSWCEVQGPGSTRESAVAKINMVPSGGDVSVRRFVQDRSEDKASKTSEFRAYSVGPEHS